MNKRNLRKAWIMEIAMALSEINETLIWIAWVFFIFAIFGAFN